MALGRVVTTYRISVGDGRSTEALVAAGNYGYAHSCVTSETFPARHPSGAEVRDIVLVEFGRELMADEALREATALGLARPTYEDALYFGIQHPDVQRTRSLIFLHEPWFGYFGRWDVVILWCNAGRRELGLEGVDDPLAADYAFAFVRPPAAGAAGVGPT